MEQGEEVRAPHHDVFSECQSLQLDLMLLCVGMCALQAFEDRRA